MFCVTWQSTALEDSNRSAILKSERIALGYVQKKLRDWFDGLDAALVALSGGVDSSLLAAVAVKCLGNDAIAVTVASELQSAEDLEIARNIAEAIGIEHLILDLKALDIPEILENDKNRCYHCKYAMADLLCEVARSRQISTVVDGTNASDREDERPGMLALRQHGIRMPLRELGIAKPTVRKMAHELSLPNADYPSRSCLATRILGPLSNRRLKRVEKAERLLPKVARITDRDDVALVKLPPGMDLADDIIRSLQELGYEVVRVI
jgi:uncharacterized protein